ncbi:restriction endonuclease subunit S [Flavobacterium sp.]|uniref:restriction endonuclease subunit S n=1 Tax=Flavobacterium sp. TaxID=239 RepID=UPI0035AEC1B1
MQSNYKRLGDYIQEVNIRNKDLKQYPLLGVSIKKEMIISIANTVGTDMSTYKIIQKNQFAYGPVTSRNGDKISIALSNEEQALLSQAYVVFETNNLLLPEYLMMWFRRPEFDRYARYKSHGSAREIFDWQEMSEVMLPIPSLEKQQEMVNEYHTIQNRINLNNQLIAKLEETAQTIYKQWFVDFEFPFDFAQGKPSENGKPYKSNGGKMVWCEELEKEIPEGWELKRLEDEVTIIRGASPRPIDEFMSKDNSGKPWVKISDATACSTRYLFETNEYISQKGVSKSREVKTGTLILSNSASPGLPRLMMIDACVHDGWLIFKNYKNITREILVEFLIFNKKDIVSSSNGSVFNNLKTEILKEYRIFVPEKKMINRLTSILQKLNKQLLIRGQNHQKLEGLKELLLGRMVRS